MICDAHLHSFHLAFFQALYQEAQKLSPDLAPLEVLAPSFQLELPSPPGKHTARWLKELDQAGVQQVACFASHPQEAEVVAQMAKDYPQRFCSPLKVLRT
jgi:Tat protein secretion system quality control protein TatD with DNase activity